VEEVTSEGHKLEATLPQQQIPWRRGRPRKNKEVGGEIQIPLSRVHDQPRGAPNACYPARACQNHKSRERESSEKDRSLGF
jgi:hypothetical protein